MLPTNHSPEFRTTNRLVFERVGKLFLVGQLLSANKSWPTFPWHTTDFCRPRLSNFCRSSVIRLSRTVSELSQRILKILDTLRLEPPFEGLGDNVRCLSWAYCDWLFFRFVTIHAFERQTEGQTEFSLLDRVCIPCSLVKIRLSVWPFHMHIGAAL